MLAKETGIFVESAIDQIRNRHTSIGISGNIGMKSLICEICVKSRLLWFSENTFPIYSYILLIQRNLKPEILTYGEMIWKIPFRCAHARWLAYQLIYDVKQHISFRNPKVPSFVGVNYGMIVHGEPRNELRGQWQRTVTRMPDLQEYGYAYMGIGISKCHRIHG